MHTHEQKKTPKGLGQLVLYLDFDGVLHHEDVRWHPRRGAYMQPTGYRLFEHAELLVELMSPYPEVAIVLSTSWARRYGCYGGAKHLPGSLRCRVIGSTFHSQMNETSFLEKPRGLQVWEDVVRRQPLCWMALDDDAEGWPHWCADCLVRTPWQLGISAPGVRDEVAQQLERLRATKRRANDGKVT